MQNLVIERFNGQAERFEKDPNPNKPTFKELKDLIPDQNGNLKTVRSPEVIGVTATEAKDFYVQKDGTVFWPTFDGGDTYTRTLETIEITDRETLINQQSDAVDNQPYLLVDGAKLDTAISGSTFPSYGIPFTDKSEVIPLGDGRFITLELGLELTSILNQSYPSQKNIDLFDSNIVVSMDVFDGYTKESFIREKIYEPSIELVGGGLLWARDVSFPIIGIKGDNKKRTYIQQFLGWDYAVNDSETSIFIVVNSCMHYSQDWSIHTVDEVFKIIEVDISGTTAQITNIYSPSIRDFENNPRNEYTALSSFKKGFSCAMANENSLINLKGHRFTLQYDMATSTVSNQVDSVLDLPYNSCLLYAEGDNEAFVWVYNDGIYSYDATTGNKTGLKLISTIITNGDYEKAKILLRKSRTNESYIYLPTTAGATSVYPLDLNLDTIGSADSNANNFPLFYNVSWTKFCDPRYGGEDASGAVLNQTILKTNHLDAFRYIVDSQHDIYGNKEHIYFKDVFVNRIVDDETYEFKNCSFVAIGVRFNNHLYTPPINYTLVLANRTYPLSQISLDTYSIDIINKAVSDSFTDVDEVFMFGNEQSSITNYFFISSKFTTGNEKTLSLVYNTIAPDSPNYEKVMGIEPTDSFQMFYKSICRVRSRTFVVAATSTKKSLESISQQVFYTDGHPISVNENSDYFLISEIQKPVRCVPVNQYAFILGEEDVGFIYDVNEVATFRFKGSTCSNSLATDGDVAIYLSREGIVAARHDRVEVISDNLIDPDLFRNLSESNFLNCSGAIDSTHGIYALNIPSENKTYCFEIRSIIASLYNTIPYPSMFTVSTIGGSGFESITISKLRSYGGHAYALVQFYEATGGINEWAAVKLFSVQDGQTTNLFGSGLLSTQGYNNLQSCVMTSNKIALGGLNERGPRKVKVRYYATDTLNIEVFTYFNGSEQSLGDTDLPSGGTATNRIERTVFINNAIGDFFYYKITHSGFCEIERVEFLG